MPAPSTPHYPARHCWCLPSSPDTARPRSTPLDPTARRNASLACRLRYPPSMLPFSLDCSLRSFYLAAHTASTPLPSTAPPQRVPRDHAAHLPSSSPRHGRRRCHHAPQRIRQRTTPLDVPRRFLRTTLDYAGPPLSPIPLRQAAPPRVLPYPFDYAPEPSAERAQSFDYASLASPCLASAFDGSPRVQRRTAAPRRVMTAPLAHRIAPLCAAPPFVRLRTATQHGPAQVSPTTPLLPSRRDPAQADNARYPSPRISRARHLPARSSLGFSSLNDHPSLYGALSFPAFQPRRLPVRPPDFPGRHDFATRRAPEHNNRQHPPLLSTLNRQRNPAPRTIVYPSRRYPAPRRATVALHPFRLLRAFHRAS